MVVNKPQEKVLLVQLNTRKVHQMTNYFSKQDLYTAQALDLVYDRLISSF